MLLPIFCPFANNTTKILNLKKKKRFNVCADLEEASRNLKENLSIHCNFLQERSHSSNSNACELRYGELDYHDYPSKSCKLFLFF